MKTGAKNIFCNRSDLHNEADVEALFIEPLLHFLGYPTNRIRRKSSIERLVLPTTGAHGENYRPDYVLMDSGGKPVLVVDAKSPDENPSAYRYQVTGYALLINQRFVAENPIRYCMVSNGIITELLEWDREHPVLVLRFDDFESGNSNFVSLRSSIGYGVFNQEQAVREISPNYQRPTVGQVIAVFSNVHNIIRNSDKLGPTKAFYELAKLMFVKLRQDRHIHDKISDGDVPTRDDFYFTVDWIDRQPIENPISDTLFDSIQLHLESEYNLGRKKRIFLRNEKIELQPSTIKEVVRLLENLDLHGIDEDLNGRMFETFLNATVRGRELGQFFTPRPVVKYMTKSAQLKLLNRNLPHVIDGCCGSGGFLIEALVELSYVISNSGHLTNAEKDELNTRLETDTLYGIEANDEIGRIARLNMYLHGDGGSRIYVTDALDKALLGEPGVSDERQIHLEELRNKIQNQNLLFDVVLTNPPFSLSYSPNDAGQRIILEQYDVSGGRKRNSNVLFIERYRDLLAASGELLTVIDDTVLNGVNSDYIRDFIRDNFVIRQVVSLPFNTFYRAEAGIKTSVLHLRRKQPGEEQGDVFMAIANNVGHDNYKNDTPHRDNLPEITNLFLNWDTHGEVPSVIRQNEIVEPLGCPMQVFVVPSTKLEDRLDAFYYAPRLQSLRDDLYARVETGEIEIRKGSDFNLSDPISPEDRESLRTSQCRYIEISDVTRNGLVDKYRDYSFEDLPKRSNWIVQEWDVLFTKLRTSRGTSFVTTKNISGHIATSGFISVRAQNEEDALILWSIFRSKIWKRQVYYLSITATQAEVRDHIFLNEMVIPWPVDNELRTKIIGTARELLQTQQQEYLAAETNTNVLDALIME